MSERLGAIRGDIHLAAQLLEQARMGAELLLSLAPRHSATWPGDAGTLLVSLTHPRPGSEAAPVMTQTLPATLPLESLDISTLPFNSDNHTIHAPSAVVLAHP